MSHIDLPGDLPGILGPMAFRPETAKRPPNQLAETLLRGPSTLSSAERELIATFVSSGNDCHFCQSSHPAPRPHTTWTAYEALVDAVKLDFRSAWRGRQAQGPAGGRRQRCARAAEPRDRGGRRPRPRRRAPATRSCMTRS